MLAIPLKQTGDVDLVKPLKSVISSRRNLTATDSSSLEALQSLRANMVTNIRDKTYTEAAVLNMQNYYDQLGNLELKVPFDQTKIYFKWLDAFDTNHWFGSNIPYTMSTNLRYEKACVLFNIGALASQIAARQSLQNDVGMREAVRLLQSAAGIFSAVSTPPPASPTEQKPTPDLVPDTAAALAALCLAQAQELVLLKAFRDNKKAELVARLARQTETQYAATAGLLRAEKVTVQWDNSWLPALNSKQALYSGLAQLCMARSCKENSNIGETIARLRLAKERLAACSGSLVGDLKAEADGWMGDCEKELQDAIKDNEFIYFAAVPAVEDLAELAGVAVARPIPLPDPFLSDSPDLFIGLAAILDPGTAKKAECIIS